MLALVWGIKHFRPYLYGQSFEVRTDHNSLKWLYSFREPERQIARWLEVLAEYEFTITHRPGVKHTNADALSRSSLEHPHSLELTAAPVSPVYSNNWLGATMPGQIQAAQREDPNLLAVATWLEEDVVPQHCPKNCSKALQTLWNQRHHLILQNGIVYRCWRDVQGKGINPKLQLVVPKHWVPEILANLHDSSTAAHLGMKKTLEKARDRFYWIRQRHDVEQWCASCAKCASRKSPSKKPVLRW